MSRRHWIALLALTAVLTLASCGPGRPAQPRTDRSGPPRIGSALLRTTAQGLCAAENAQEMGVERLGQLYDAGPGRYLIVARAGSAARHKLRDAMSALVATGGDRSALRRLVEDQDAVLAARGRLLRLVDGQPARGRLDLVTGPSTIVRAYRDVVGAYVAAGGDFLAAGVPACATPMITVLVGPGQDEASAATVEFRIAAACHTVGYTTHAERPTSSTANVASLGTVVQPGTHKPGDRYDGSSGRISPAVAATEVVVLTSVHFPVESATCVTPGPPTPAPKPN
jgi:hypothetical protein